MKHKTWSDVLRVNDGWLTSDDEDDAPARKKGRGQRQGQGQREGQGHPGLHTAMLCAASFACALVTSQRGPSVLDLGHLVGADLEQTAALFAVGAGGHVTGCLVTGVAFGRFGPRGFVLWSLLCVCGATVALPWCAGYPLMAAVYFLSLLAVGCVETGCYGDVARRRGREGTRVLQLLQLSFVAGGVVSPALTQAFLLPSRDLHALVSAPPPTDVTPGNATAFSPFLLAPSLPQSNGSGGAVALNATPPAGHAHSSTQVGYAYVITGLAALAAAVPFLLARALDKEPAQGRTVAEGRGGRGERRGGRSDKRVLALAGVVFVAVTGVEESLPHFLAPLLVTESGWSSGAAALLTSWFWAAVTLVRLAAALSPGRAGDTLTLTLALSLTGLPLSVAGLRAAVVWRSVDGVWSAVFVAGMSVSLLSPAAFLWLHAHLPHPPGALSATVMAASALGGVVNPLVVGRFWPGGGAGEAWAWLLVGEGLLALLAWLGLVWLARGVRGREELRARLESVVTATAAMGQGDSGDEDGSE